MPGMADVSNYQRAGQLVDKVEAKLDTPERILAAAQVDALRAVADQVALLRGEMSRVADALEGKVPDEIGQAAHLLRDQIRSFAR